MAITRLGGANAISGIIPVANGGTGASSFTKGKVLQVTQNTNTSHSHSVSGNTYTDITFNSVVFEGTITPSSSSNKILILPSIPFRTVHNASNDARCTITILGKIGSSSYANIFFSEQNAILGGYDYGASGLQIGEIFTGKFLWSPSTTSECKVKFQIANNASSGASVSVNRSGYGASVILMEVEG